MNILEYDKLYSFSLGPAAGPADGGPGRPVTRGQDQRLDGFRMASMDISLIPCMPGIILPPSWGAYKCVLCNSGHYVFSEGSASDRRKASRGSTNQNVAG